MIKKDRLNGVAAAIYRKPSTNECYNERARNDPPLCSESDDPNTSWYFSFLPKYLSIGVALCLLLVAASTEIGSDIKER